MGLLPFFPDAICRLIENTEKNNFPGDQQKKNKTRIYKQSVKVFYFQGPTSKKAKNKKTKKQQKVKLD